MFRFVALCLVVWPMTAAGLSQTASANDGQIKRLLERIARGEGVDATDAADELIARITRPLETALDTFDAKTVDRQRRVQQALSRVTARIRARLFRSALPADERAQLDRFAQLNQPLIDQLFADAPQQRIEAIGRIPVEVGTGAGVAVTAGLYDRDENVATAAFEACREFASDESVGKGLTRFIDYAMAAHKAGHFVDEEVAAELVMRVGEAVTVFGELKYTPGVPSAVRAVRLYTTPSLSMFFFNGLSNVLDRSRPIEALGKIGDPRAAPVLIDLLAENQVTGNRSLGGGRLLERTLGDEALMSLLTIFKLDPADYDFIITADARKIAGFVEDKNRQKARNKFKAWYRQHVADMKDGPGQATAKP